MSKYQSIIDYAVKAKNKDPYVSNIDIARAVKTKLKRKETVEQLRKIISRGLLNTKLFNLTEEAIVAIQRTGKGLKKEPAPTIVWKEVKDVGELTYTEYSEVPRKSQFRKPGTYLVLGCAHVPGHNKAMINGITKLIPEIKDLKGLMLIGDFLDLNSLSGHDKDKFTAIPGLTLDKEYIEGNHVLNALTKNLPKDAEKVYIYGNHEDRWKRYMANMQNAKAPLASPAEALNLEGRGFHVFDKWTSDYVTLGSHLELLHGQYYNTHCAKQHIDKFRGSVMFAHTHRIQMYVEGKTGGFNIGWAGDVNSPLFSYAERGTKGQWQNGFALVTIDTVGNYYVQQVFCHNDKFYYNGKSYN